MSTVVSVDVRRMGVLYKTGNVTYLVDSGVGVNFGWIGLLSKNRCNIRSFNSSTRSFCPTNNAIVVCYNTAIYIFCNAYKK